MYLCNCRTWFSVRISWGRGNRPQVSFTGRSLYAAAKWVYQNYHFNVAVEGVSKWKRRAAKPSNVHNRRCSDHREQTVGGMSSHTNRPRERSNNSLSYNLFDLSRGRRVGRHATSAGSATPHAAVMHIGRLCRPHTILIHPLQPGRQIVDI